MIACAPARSRIRGATYPDCAMNGPHAWQSGVTMSDLPPPGAPWTAPAHWDPPRPTAPVDPTWAPPAAWTPPGDPGWALPTGQTWEPAVPSRRRRRGGPIGGAIGALAAFLAKWGVLLYKLKYVTVFASMLVSIAAYSLLFGWAFAVGFVLLLLVHESGHALEMRRQGVPASAPMFIPFVGAVISMRGRPLSAYQEARIGLAGPAFGAAGSAVVALMGAYEGSNFLRALAFVGFFLNLFNLFPALPLDGGRAVGALHPALWLAGLVGLLAVEVWRPSPILVLVIVLGGIELWRRWKSRNSPASKVYNALSAAQRAGIGATYLALVGLCLAGMDLTYFARTIS
jgi:Zn-dependent protease